MQKRDNSKSGKIDWVQFCCGAGLGGIGGAWVAFTVFSHWWAVLLTIAVAAGVLGLCCGLWGVDFWEVLFSFDWL